MHLEPGSRFQLYLLAGLIIVEGSPIRSKAVVILLILTFLSPAYEAAGSGTDCCGCASAAATPADLFGGETFPVDADPGNPCGGESQDCCSCETGQPLFADLSAGSGISLPFRESVGPNCPSDTSLTFSSEIFRPPLS